MIHIFRKEIKNWYPVLYFFLFAFVLGLAGTLFWRRPDVNKLPVAKVNGSVVTLKKYQKALVSANKSLSMIQEYARMYGIANADFLKSILGVHNPGEMALDTCIKEALVDEVRSSFDIQIGSQHLKEKLAESIPRGLVDERGIVKMDAYHEYLRGLSLTPSEYEDQKEEQFKRALLERFIMTTLHIPSYYAKSILGEAKSEKSFNIVTFPYESFLKQEQEKKIDEQVLKDYYNKNIDDYRVPEGRSADYWLIKTDEYAKGITIVDNDIKRFYDRNKSSRFRVPPQVNVRRIVITNKEGEGNGSFLTRAQRIYEQVKGNPENFVEYVRQFSDDKDFAKSDGLTGIFSRGTHGESFENAAFRLFKSGSVSGLVKTDNGYEILQLVERIKASAKPLKDVKDEIVSLLRAKKALIELKSNLSIMLHEAKSNPHAIDKFAQNHKFQKNNTPLLQQGKRYDDNILAEITQNLFSPKSRARKHGYFLQDDTYVVYRLDKTRKSYVREIDEVREDLLNHFHHDKAYNTMQSLVKDVKYAILNNKTTLVEAAKKHNLSIKNTDLIKIDDKSKVKDLGIPADILPSMFRLDGQGQLLHKNHNRNALLIQLEKIRHAPMKDVRKEIREIVAKKKIEKGRQQLGSFIASLKRNAKIDIDENVLKMARIK